jgi:hypothetical protein
MTLLTLIVCAGTGTARYEDRAKAIIDKAAKAMGGEKNLENAEAFTWKVQGQLISNGNPTDFSSQVTVKGLDQLRREFGNDRFKMLIVIEADRGWRRVRNQSIAITGGDLANEKRTLYLQAVPIRLTLLRRSGFKYEAAADQNVGDRVAEVLKATGPDGKEFTLYFDKQSGLPVKEVATLTDAQGVEYAIEVTFDAYKEFDGIKKATKLEVRRDGEIVQKLEVTEFKILKEVDPQTFSEPK